MDGIFSPFSDPLGIKNYEMKRDEDREFGAISTYMRPQHAQPQPDLEGFKRDQQATLHRTCAELAHSHADAQVAAHYKDKLTHALTRRHIPAIAQGAWPDAPKLRDMCRGR